MKPITIAISLLLAVLGFAAGWFLKPAPKPEPLSPTLVDLAALPDELREKYRDPKHLELVAKQDEMMKAFAAEKATLEPAVWPQSITPPDYVSFYKPAETSRWPTAKLTGDSDALAAAKSGWTVMSLWASWCAPCIEELPDFETLNKRYVGKGITFLAVNVDTQNKDTLESARAIYAKRGVKELPLILAESEAEKVSMLHVFGMSKEKFAYPAIMVFGPDGNPVGRTEGLPVKLGSTESAWKSPEMIAFFDSLAAQK